MNEIQRLTNMHPDEEFLHSMSDWIQTIKIIDQEYGGVRGICIEESRYQCIYCNRHENEEDIESTSEHESIHGCCTDEYNESLEDWDIEQEHIMIRNFRWIKETFNEDTYYSIVRGKHVKPKICPKEYKKLMKKVNKMSDKLDACLVE